MDRVTLSRSAKIPHGESFDIHQLLTRGDEAWLDPGANFTIPSSTFPRHFFTQTLRNGVLIDIK
jgi:hypothetical protein